MRLDAGFLVPLEELCSRMPVCASCCSLPQMTAQLCLLLLSGLAVSSQLGLEDVFYSPRDQTVREGEGVFLQCVSGESSPAAGISWLHDGEVVTRGRHIQGEYGGGHQKKTSATLHLFNVTLEDDGIYICLTHNALLNISKKSKPAKLTVRGVPRKLQIIQGPDNITVAMGTEVSMHCSVRGFPVPMVHWFKDGCPLTDCSASFSLHNNGQLLTFRNVTKQDEGSYHCEASNLNETIKSLPAFLLPAEMDWSFVDQPTNLTVRGGENVTLVCRPPYSRPAALVSWFKNSQLLERMNHTSLLPSGDLVLHSVQESDSGSYFCRASNIHLQRFLTSRRATLTVQAPPLVTLWPQVLTVASGSRAELQCRVSGHPLPSIRWVKRGSKQTGGRISTGLRNATLYIQSARSYDEGVYVCEASNALGRSHGSALLRVAASPVIVTFVGEVKCMMGAPVVLPCRAVGIEPITYTWSRTTAHTLHHSVTTGNTDSNKDGALHISSVRRSDAGEYFCTAENRAGRHQRRTMLTITDEDHPADRDKQTRLVLSASTHTNEEIPLNGIRNFLAEQHLKTTSPQQEQRFHSGLAATIPTILRKTVAELKMSSKSGTQVLQPHQNQPTTSPTQPLITQMQPPILPPPPHPNFQSANLHSQLPAGSRPLFTSKTRPPVFLNPTSVSVSEDLGTTVQHLPTVIPTHLTLTTVCAKFPHQLQEKLPPTTDSPSSPTGQVKDMSQAPSKLPIDEPNGSFSLDTLAETQRSVTDTQRIHSGSDTFTVTIQDKSQPSPAGSPQSVTKTPSSESYHEMAPFSIPPTVETHSRPPQTSSQASQTHPQPFFTSSLTPRFPLELSTVQHPLTSTQPTPQLSQSHLPTTLANSEGLQPSPTQHPQLSPSTVKPPDQDSSSATLASEVVNHSDQRSVTQKDPPVQSVKPANDTELTDWLKRNTSQSPMTSNDPRVTQSPSWLPVLQKHDIPIVVGVGVSLAFIFITVTFYSVVQKNEPVPTNRAAHQTPSDTPYISLTAQRNLGVPSRHGERHTAGRTYENRTQPMAQWPSRSPMHPSHRAFEDDDCVAVIEHSPNTSDTRARPPGPSLVAVQMEPTSEDCQEDSLPLDNQSVTVETYPEPIVDTKIDPTLEEEEAEEEEEEEEEKGCSLSQPSIQLHCTEGWSSSRADNHSPCQDTLPPPSSLPSRSPTPSPPSRREEGLHSSLTLHSTEPCVAPIHHSLSISRGHPPLLLSHHVSLGLTTVAVDVHFYPAATASMPVASSTHISSVSNATSVTAPLFSPSLVNSQENEQSTSRLSQCK